MVGKGEMMKLAIALLAAVIIPGGLFFIALRIIHWRHTKLVARPGLG